MAVAARSVEDLAGSVELRGSGHALALAAERGFTSVAFPAISTGVYGYPIRDAAQVALAPGRDVDARARHHALDRVGCGFGDRDAGARRAGP